MLNDVKTNSLVSLFQLEPQEIKHAQVLSGVSPFVLRRVFGFWMLFVLGIAGIVSVAPGLSMFFVSMTFIVLLLFTFLIFYQSRISEGWPAILYYHGRIGVVKDPISRQFLFVAPDIVKSASPMLLKPNKKAVAIELDTSALSDNDKFLLEQAIWPSENKLIALSYFKKRETICDAIAQLLQKKRTPTNFAAASARVTS
ncbi:hypothetical protein [Alteromonas sp. AMM-1]|uniref:hypothetical protein n=1 Tax=Alteromonas sp. AMM-1 TaxID=3394233 RepID=UPI0039A4D619